ncbi:MAG: DNA recombination protein RmuC [Alphaproteobacteria bacterium]|nr:DNA recombination protein RmuC [Alphaproteobacteria bacterium]MDA8013427.1 DNA recombination protein RmuC [Alphaproteobacteria bacterium]
MTALVVILFLIVLAVNLVLAVFVLRALRDDGKSEETLRYEGEIDASLKQIRAQMDGVNVGLGKIETLAGGVDSLERVLSGVKTRGIWAEVQLEHILKDILPGRYEEQVSVKEGSERGGVDFAVRLPREHGGDEKVLLPIDVKFPLTHYQRVVEANSVNDEKDARKSLEQEVMKAAKSVNKKYIAPPRTTDFALMYVPTEGLFAELAQNSELMNDLRKERVVLCGPVNVEAILWTIRSGYQLVAIEENAQRVKDTLAGVRREFEKFDSELESIHNSFTAAGNKLRNLMETRQRQMRRALEGADKLEDN